MTDNTITVPRDLRGQAHKLVHQEAARHTVDTEWTRCDEALRTALSQPQQERTYAGHCTFDPGIQGFIPKR